MEDFNDKGGSELVMCFSGLRLQNKMLWCNSTSHGQHMQFCLLPQDQSTESISENSTGVSSSHTLKSFKFLE